MFALYDQFNIQLFYVVLLLTLGSADFLGVSFHGASRCSDMNYTSDDVSFEMDSDAACVSELDGER